VLTIYGIEQANDEEHQERLASLQFLFNIKDNRRQCIEQRLLRESMMDAMRGFGDQPSLLGQNYDGQSMGAAGERGADDFKALSQMLNSMPSGDVLAAAPRGAAGALDPSTVQRALAEMGMPDLSKMGAAEAAGLSKEVVGQVRWRT
jgi:hypothetical protein